MRFLLTRKWIALTLACISVLPAFNALSQWQWRRLDERLALNAQVSGNQNAPALTAMAASTSGKAQEWRNVSMCGHWDESAQVLVRRRTLNSEAGYWVATPLVTADVTYIVVRGFHLNAESSTSNPMLNQLPRDEVCITGRLRMVTPRSSNRPSDLPQGQVDQLIPQEIKSTAVATTYVEMTASKPDSATDVTTLPAPELSEGPHRSYAIQWWIFALMTIVGWVVLVRNEYLRSKSDSETH